MKVIKIQEIYQFLMEEGYQAKLYGEMPDMNIDKYCPLSDLSENSVTWIKKMTVCSLKLAEIDIPLLIITDEMPENPYSHCINFIIGKNPKGMYFDVLRHYFLKQDEYRIASTAIVETRDIGKEVSIGHHTYICSDVKIGERVIIKNNVSIECKTVIGDDCIIESGTVIGSAGYGYFDDANGKAKKAPDFGGVRIGNNVEIGANTCIDRGTLGDTIIEDGAKIDNLCHIAHNVHIEKYCFVIALSLLGGSAHLKEKAYIAPGALIINQATIGENALVGMGAVVTKDVEANKVVAGVPARILREV